MCVKTFAIPKLLIRASVIPLPNELVKEANSTIYTFIWNSKDKVKRYALISDIEKGGLDNVARVKSQCYIKSDQFFGSRGFVNGCSAIDQPHLSKSCGLKTFKILIQMF